MKGLKIVRALSMLASCVFLILFIPFGYFETLPSLAYRFQFTFTQDDFTVYFKAVEGLNQILMAVQYGSIALGCVIFISYLLTFVKKPAVKTMFTWLSVLCSLLAFPAVLLKMTLLQDGGMDWVIGGVILVVAVMDLVLNITDEVATRVKASAGTSTTIIQQVAGAGQMQDANMLNGAFNAEELTDSLAARKRIESLKSGLSIPSYDEALQEIDATGEWNGLDMKDVQAFDINDEIRKTEQMRNMNQYGTNDSSSWKN